MEAYDKVKDNYPSFTTGMTAFYREIIRRQSGRYLALSEAVIDINKASYTSFQNDRPEYSKAAPALITEPQTAFSSASEVEWWPLLTWTM